MKKQLFVLFFAAMAMVGVGCQAEEDAAPAQNQEAEVLELNEEEQAEALDETRAFVDVYLVALEDAGEAGKEIGCGDSLVPVKKPATGSEDIEEQVEGALDELFAIDDESYGDSGLYNALYQSDVEVDNVTVEDNGVAEVELTGSIIQGGTCDTPRVEEQIIATIDQFEDVDTVLVTLDGVALDDALSGEGN